MQIVRIAFSFLLTAFFLCIPHGNTFAQGRPPALVRADVVALDQLLVYNRFGSFNPFGMIFALGRDVTKRENPVISVTAEDCSKQLGTEGENWDFDRVSEKISPSLLPAKSIARLAGTARLRDCKRPRPMVLRGSVGDVLEVRIANLLISSTKPGSSEPAPPIPGVSASDQTAKPGLTDTFCKGHSSGPRYGNLPAGLPNDEDEVWNGTRQMCANLSDTGVNLNANPHLTNGYRVTSPQHGINTNKPVDADWPTTRHISFVINGLTGIIDDAGSIHPACRGLGAIEPGEVIACRWKLDAEGTHFISSQAAPSGGEGDGGSLTHGLFGALIVEKAGSEGYRSQVTSTAFDTIWKPGNKGLNAHARAANRMEAKAYDELDPVTNRPILNLHQTTGSNIEVKEDATKPAVAMPLLELVHSDLNAIISECAKHDAAGKCLARKNSFREFTAILHDELKSFYTDNFQELQSFGAGQLSGARDGFAINYGASGMGTLMIANRKRIGPAADCVECLYEEFFLQSWANGDPALLEHYPDDPSNVHHSYMNDRIVFRNFHAGPKETHVFHLHAHQWFAGNDRNRGSYLDSQTVGPQQGFSYKIYSGGLDQFSKDPSKPDGFWNTLGSGNRNRTPGDSIFHCHLYPHFAQGMWALWRNHDVLEDGTRKLPDGQQKPGLSLTVRDAPQAGANGIPQPMLTRKGTNLAGGPSAGNDGTPIPGIIPLIDEEDAPPLLPTYGTEDGMPGYPFYIPGQAGRRAPQPPLDIARKLEPGPNPPPADSGVDSRVVGAEYLDGGLPRHVVKAGVRKFEAAAGHAPEDKTESNNVTMAKTAGDTLARSLALGDFGAEIKKVDLQLLPNDGTTLERRAMAFHFNGQRIGPAPGDTTPTQGPELRMPNGQPATYDPIKGGYIGDASDKAYRVNGSPPRPGAPFADPCALPSAAAGGKVWRDSEGRLKERALTKLADGLIAGFPEQITTNFTDFVPDPGFIGFRRYEVSAINAWLVMNRAGWHDPQARINVLTSLSSKIKRTFRADERPRSDQEPFFFRATSGECIEFRHTNELPKDLEKDDFQVKTPTDTIGQHIHLVKFDVMSADGSANGWNYEDGTFAPMEILGRICAAKNGGMAVDSGNGAPGEQTLRLAGRVCEQTHHIEREPIQEQRAWFQTTVQRWFADPMLSTTGRKEMKLVTQAGDNELDKYDYTDTPEMRDRTLRTVFTHDHFGPSSIQQHGFYSALVIEPQRHWVCRDKLDNVKKDCAADRERQHGATASNGYKPDVLLGQEQMVGARRLIIMNKELEREYKSEALSDADLLLDTNSADYDRARRLLRPYIAPANATPDEKKRETAEQQLSAQVLAKLNTREYALAIADFAILYEPVAESAERQAVNDDRGLVCLLKEATAKLSGSPFATINSLCRGGPVLSPGTSDAEALKQLRKSNDVPPAVLAPLGPGDIVILKNDVMRLRGKYGKPIAAPRRPEAISVDHHDPYLVNYKHEPFPLRIGTDKPNTDQPVSFLGTCAQPWPGRQDHDRSIRWQRRGTSVGSDWTGDMSRVFMSLFSENPLANLSQNDTLYPSQRTILHNDPCTPIIEAYAGERVQVRLIQGAQEVQHAFTVEGYTFPRNIDQRYPSSSILPMTYAGGLPRTRQRECYEADEHLPAPPRIHAFLGIDVGSKNSLRANCDNVDGRVAAREIGISEHFEFGAAFTSEGTNSEANNRFLKYQLDKDKFDLDKRGLEQQKLQLQNALRRLNEQQSGGTLRPSTIPQPHIFGRNDIARQLPDLQRRIDGVQANIDRYGDSIRKLRKDTGLPASDSLYHFGSQDALWNGAWGLLRVFNNRASIDHGACYDGLAYKAPYDGLNCLKATGDRIASLAMAREKLELTSFSAAAPSSDNDIPEDTSLTIDCPVEKQFRHKFKIDAEKLGVMGYMHSPRWLRDPEALRFSSTDPGSKVASAVGQGKHEHPIIIRIPAGSCLDLTITNKLPPEYKETAQGQPIEDKPGDARMPHIVPLNTDRGGWNKASGVYQAAENGSRTEVETVWQSNRLAVSLPMTTTISRRTFAAPFGQNPVEAVAGAGVGTTIRMVYYAGTMRSDWGQFDDAVGHLTQQHMLCTGLPNLKPGLSGGIQGVDILGRRYTIQQTVPLNPAKLADLEACLRPLITLHKQPKPYAFGPLPLRSFGDVIGQMSHGLFGTVIVEPAGTTHERVSYSTNLFGSNAGKAATAHLSLPKIDIDLAARPKLPNGPSDVVPCMLPDGTKCPAKTSLPGAKISEHVLFWQDGLNLHTTAKRSMPWWLDLQLAHNRQLTRLELARRSSASIGPVDPGQPASLDNDAAVELAPVRLPPIQRKEISDYLSGRSITLNSRFWDWLHVSMPVADCHVCDDSYDFGKRGVNYTTGMLADRMALPGRASIFRPEVHGAFDLNEVSIPQNIYRPTFAPLHLPPLWSLPETDVVFQIIHPGGRARQRAFVMTGAGYHDLFPSFGFANAALLMPGKALTAHMIRRAQDGDCNLWRDGPNYMIGQGVWGLHRVQAPIGQSTLAPKDTTCGKTD